MDNKLRIQHLLSDHVRPVHFDSANERLLLTLVNAEGEEKEARIYIGDNTIWIGIDGYGEPGNKDEEATQVLVDVYHMDLTEASEAYDGVNSDAFARVARHMGDDDAEPLWFNDLRLLTPRQAINEMAKVLEHKHLQSTEKRIRDILDRVRQEDEVAKKLEEETTYPDKLEVHEQEFNEAREE